AVLPTMKSGVEGEEDFESLTRKNAGDGFLMLVPRIERIPSGFGGVGRFHRIWGSAARAWYRPRASRATTLGGALAAILNALRPANCLLPTAFCPLVRERVAYQALKDTDGRLMRKHERASGHDISVFQRELSGQYGVGHHVGKNDPGRAGRELPSRLGAGLL